MWSVILNLQVAAMTRLKKITSLEISLCWYEERVFRHVSLYDVDKKDTKKDHVSSVHLTMPI